MKIHARNLHSDWDGVICGMVFASFVLNYSAKELGKTLGSADRNPNHWLNDFRRKKAVAARKTMRLFIAYLEEADRRLAIVSNQKVETAVVLRCVPRRVMDALKPPAPLTEKAN